MQWRCFGLSWGCWRCAWSCIFALPMFITIKKIIILHLFLGVPAATVGGTGTPWHTRGYAPALSSPALGCFSQKHRLPTVVASSIVTSIVQWFCVSRNHSSNERSQSASQTYMVETTALHLWLAAWFLVNEIYGLKYICSVNSAKLELLKLKYKN